MVTNSINPIKKRIVEAQILLPKKIEYHIFYEYVFTIKYKICKSTIISNLKNIKFFR